VQPAAPMPSDNRVEYAHGDLTEWYVNDERGLEQGFRLPAPPEGMKGLRVMDEPTVDVAIPGRGRDVRPEDLVHLDLALEGNLSARVPEGGAAVEFVTPEGARAVRYAELKVTDATGQPLPAWMEGWNAGGRRGVRLVIDARGAAWPVEVDPLATNPVWSAEYSPEYSLGTSVSTAGDVNGDGYADVILGAPHYYEQGRAYLFLGGAAGPAYYPSWSAEGDQVYAYFGNSVSTAGDVNGDGYADVIVGASMDGGVPLGRAYVYLGSASGLSSSPAWIAQGDQAGTSFGYSVSTAGDVNGDGYSDVIVGDPDSGRAYVYLGSASGLSPSAAWTSSGSGGTVIPGFGYSVSTAGDVNGDGYSDVIVGAIYFTNGENYEGGAFVYLGSPSGLGSAPGSTLESDRTESRFGNSVSTAGDVNGDGYSDVIVGAPYYSNGQWREGRAFLYLGSAGGLSTTAAWNSVESDQVESELGWSVSTAGDVNGDGYADVIVGEPFYDAVGGNYNVGRALVYLGSTSGLSPTAAWTDSRGGYFGFSVSAAGDVNGDGYADVIVGAPNSLFGGFVFLGSASALRATAGWTMEGDPDASLGYSVSAAGDVNGDGYGDVIVGAPYYNNGDGRAFVYPGSASGLSTAPAWSAGSDQAVTNYGYSVAAAGDVNGDGYGDVVVGDPLYDNGETHEGKAFLYLGSAAGLSPTPAWAAESNQAGARFGYSVSTAGDVNGDGYSDVIVGAYLFDNDQVDEGRILVYLGSASGLSGTPAWMAESHQASSRFGFSVSAAGDVNGDGYSDIIVGCHRFDNGETDEGRAFVYLGSVSGLSPAPAWTAESDQLNALFGYSVSTSGDVNGDGYSDVVVGAVNFGDLYAQEGRAFVYVGSASGLSSSPAWTADGDWTLAQLGGSVATAGDVNGDGYADVVVGAPTFGDIHQYQGRASVYQGSATGLSPFVAWIQESPVPAQFGSSVATAGDVNGDGYADVIIGAPSHEDGSGSWVGKTSLYYGNGEAGTGLSLRPQQRRADDSAPIEHLGEIHSLNSFRLAALGRTPFGRARVRLEWEVKPLGSLFDGSATQRGPAWSDSGTSGAALSEVVTSLGLSTVYHWRARLLYDPATSPLASHSRWFTIPWNGWQEGDLRNRTCHDADGDGYPLPGETWCRPGGATDCDDARAVVYPGAPQLCDALNNDCSAPGWPAVPGNEADVDGDGWRTCAGDCDDTVASTHPGAAEINDGLDNQCPADSGYGLVDEMPDNAWQQSAGDPDTFCWAPQSGATSYEVVRSSTPVFPAGCSRWVVTSPTCITDPVTPPPAGTFFYLVRPLGPFVGSWGKNWAGVERSGGCLTETACADNLDNDGDLLVDCADTDCAAASACFHCTLNSQCATGFCVDGVCCNRACCETCESCNLAGSVGTCQPYPVFQDPEGECPGTMGCSGSGGCTPAIGGQPCTSPAQCPTGFCVDGVCCDRACDGACEACDMAGTVGTCVPVPAGRDPDNECPVCGVCNGTGACGP